MADLIHPSIRTGGINKDRHTREFPFLKREFMPASKLFPSWLEAERVLSMMCDHSRGFQVRSDRLKRDFAVSLGIRKEDFDEIPTRYRGTVERTIDAVVMDYCPDLREFAYTGTKKDQRLLTSLTNAFVYKERAIIEAGGRFILDELRFRLGLQSKCE
jgi:hypothetical protein